MASENLQLASCNSWGSVVGTGGISRHLQVSIVGPHSWRSLSPMKKDQSKIKQTDIIENQSVLHIHSTGVQFAYGLLLVSVNTT